MSMKEHILLALQEQFNEWDEFLRSLNAEQLSQPLTPSAWHIQDVVAHLMAWQTRTAARFQAALLHQAPVFPTWNPKVDPETLDDTDLNNAWIYEHYRGQPWPDVYQAWQDGYRRILADAEKIPERALLDSDRYPWLEGYALSHILLATYDHHQEHWEALPSWLIDPS